VKDKIHISKTYKYDDCFYTTGHPLENKIQGIKEINTLTAVVLLVDLWKIKLRESKTINPLIAFVPLGWNFYTFYWG
jgi:hypothetical protein